MKSNVVPNFSDTDVILTEPAEIMIATHQIIEWEKQSG